jgi:hypothetical protein
LIARYEPDLLVESLDVAAFAEYRLAAFYGAGIRVRQLDGGLYVRSRRERR